MEDFIWTLIMFNLYACIFTSLYWSYTKADRLLKQLQNCTTLINRASLLRDGGLLARMQVTGNISMVVTISNFMKLSEVVSMEDIEKLPRSEKIKLAIFFWVTWGTVALMICTWAASKLLEYF